MADSHTALQSYLTNLHNSCKKFGLTISNSKTQILVQPPRGSPAEAPNIFLGDGALDVVSHFRYLGSEIRNDNRLDTEIPVRIARAASAFGKLNQRVWKSHDLKLMTKLAVYKATVLPILLYASETWCLYRRNIKQLDIFHMKCLRTILRINWEDRVTNTEVLRRAQMQGMAAMLMKAQLRWCGHVVRMEDDRLPKAVFYSQLSKGARTVGGQHLRYKDVLKRHITASGIPPDSWEKAAHNRNEWRSTVHSRVNEFEKARLETLDSNRLQRKTRPKPTYNYTYNGRGELFCNACNRTFATKLGFASHIRAHRRRSPTSP
ncbi:hypothetical protein JYU34_010512 [Plutella xylostella]|uniref:C2H2-type domain-containing protein n=1 Tax=Plutella xylostella TaxID=51655 RepID=A0ABQ7QIM7_PLUXY|nr:hypothetical protein JYU34_010512 [Plutella xylostella]